MEYPTEFDEQSETKAEALSVLRLKIAEYMRGDETMGVVSGYEVAALKKGATTADIETLWKTDRERWEAEAEANAMTPQEQVEAFEDLLYWCTSGGRYDHRNPYGIPVVEKALKALKLMRGEAVKGTNWLDAVDNETARARVDCKITRPE